MFVFLLIASFLMGFCLLKKLTQIKSPIMIISGSFLIGSVFSGTLLYWLDILFVKTLSNYYLSNIAYLVISFAFIAYVYRTNSKIFKELLDTIKEFCRDRVAIICFIAFVLFQRGSIMIPSVCQTEASPCPGSMERFNSSQRICTFHKHWPKHSG